MTETPEPSPTLADTLRALADMAKAREYEQSAIDCIADHAHEIAATLERVTAENAALRAEVVASREAAAVEAREGLRVVTAALHEREALRAEAERLREAGARVVQAFDAAKGAGSPHKLSPAAALAMNALKAALTSPSR